MGKIPGALRKAIARNILTCRTVFFGGRGGGKKCADAFGVSQQHWSPWERRKRTPDELRLREIGQFFGVTIEYLRRDNDGKYPNEEDLLKPAIGARGLRLELRDKWAAAKKAHPELIEPATPPTTKTDAPWHAGPDTAPTAQPLAPEAPGIEWMTCAASALILPERNAHLFRPTLPGRGGNNAIYRVRDEIIPLIHASFSKTFSSQMR